MNKKPNHEKRIAKLEEELNYMPKGNVVRRKKNAYFGHEWDGKPLEEDHMD